MQIILYCTNLLRNKWKFTNAIAFFAEHIELNCRWRCRCKSRCRCSWSVSGLNLTKLIPEVNIHNLSNWEMEKKKKSPRRSVKNCGASQGRTFSSFLLSVWHFSSFSHVEKAAVWLRLSQKSGKGEGRRGIPPIKNTLALWLSEADLTAAEKLRLSRLIFSTFSGLFFVIYFFF